MKLILSDSEIVVNLNNTNFVDYWISKQFDSSNQVTILVPEDQRSELNNKFRESFEYLNFVILNVNRAIKDLKCEDILNRKMEFPVSNHPTIDYLEQVHEQWAQYTKDSTGYETESWSQKNLDVYHDINSYLKNSNCHYDDVNWAVHRLEFLYKHIFLTNLKTIDRSTFEKSEYKITADDTTFSRQNLMVPFYDVGRPQYEKWAICGKVIHEEISNYINISTRLNLLIERHIISPPMEYVNECIRSNVGVYGPNLGIGDLNVRNVDKAGHDIVKSLLTTDKIILEK